MKVIKTLVATGLILAGSSLYDASQSFAQDAPKLYVKPKKSSSGDDKPSTQPIFIQPQVSGGGSGESSGGGEGFGGLGASVYDSLFGSAGGAGNLNNDSAATNAINAGTSSLQTAIGGFINKDKNNTGGFAKDNSTQSYLRSITQTTEDKQAKQRALYTAPPAMQNFLSSANASYAANAASLDVQKEQALADMQRAVDSLGSGVSLEEIDSQISELQKVRKKKVDELARQRQYQRRGGGSRYGEDYDRRSRENYERFYER